MAKFATIAAIVLAVCSVPRSRAIDRRKSSEGMTTEPADEDIRGVLRIISAGPSTEKDDEQLAKLIREEIARTAQRIKAPTGSIEAAARRAETLVTELTSAYTTAIYKSKSSEEAKTNFGRFQATVQNIVDFIKNGEFVA